jgi:hypothetical protein
LKKYKQRRERQRCIFLLKEKQINLDKEHQHLASVAIPNFADKIMVRESMNNNNISSLEVNSKNDNDNSDGGGYDTLSLWNEELAAEFAVAETKRRKRKKRNLVLFLGCHYY